MTLKYYLFILCDIVQGHCEHAVKIWLTPGKGLVQKILLVKALFSPTREHGQQGNDQAACFKGLDPNEVMDMKQVWKRVMAPR